MKENRLIWGTFSVALLFFGLGTFFFKASLEARVQEAKQSIYKPKKPSAQKKKMTQIEAHLSLPSVKKKIKAAFFQDIVKKNFGIDDLPEMVQQMNARAHEHWDTHYDFYHAQTPSLRINQDAYKAFYEFFALKAKIKNFTFLRCQDPVFSDIDTAENFIKKQFAEKGIIDDNKVNFFLLSANLSPFGNTGIPGESTYNFYATGTGIMDPARQAGFLAGIFKTFGLDEKFIPRLQELGASIDTPTGSFFQIFIPKGMADKIGYLSWRLGIPLNEEKLQEIFGKAGIFTRYADLQQKVDEIQAASARGEKIYSDALNDMLKSMTTGKYRLSTFLDSYRTNPTKVMNYVQARLVFTNNELLNPDSGIIIYRYEDVLAGKMQEYREKLARLIDEILIDWLDRNSNSASSKLSSEELGRARNLMSLMKQGREFTGQTEAPSGADTLAHIKALQELKERQASVDQEAQAKAKSEVSKLEQNLEAKRKAQLKELWEQEKAAQAAEAAQAKALEALEIQRIAQAGKSEVESLSQESMSLKATLKQVMGMTIEDARSGAINNLLAPHQTFIAQSSDVDMKNIMSSLNQSVLKKLLVQVSDPTSTFNRYKNLYKAIGISNTLKLIDERNK